MKTYLETENVIFTRTFYLSSTASGYDIHVIKQFSFGVGYYSKRKEVYTKYIKVSANTIRRFYRLSGGFIDFQTEKSISVWDMIQKQKWMKNVK